MREMTRTAWKELPPMHKTICKRQPWAMWIGTDGQSNFTPVKVLPRTKRPCARCGQDQTCKKVWAKAGKKVLCMACGPHAYFDLTNHVVEKA